MARLMFSLLLLMLNYTLICAQSDTIRVDGHVRCDNEPVEFGVVAMLQPSDSSIIAYTMTDEHGHYSLRTVKQLDEVLVRVRGFNIKEEVRRIKARSQTLDFVVNIQSIMLREVEVKSQKLWGSRDTLNYLVSAYTRYQDRTIGDVLKQLPGITIEDNGVIKYQGTPINRFYIENLDMLQGRYNLATDGIKADEVATVQVLENHEHVNALQDQMPPEGAAINLKLKDKAKGVWSKSADVSAGGYSDGMLWGATMETMYFGKARQHLIRYSGDNMGRSHNAASAHYGNLSGDNPQMAGIVGHSSSPVGNSLFGYAHGVNLNNLVKLSDHKVMNYNFNYSHNLSHGNSFSQTTYIQPDNSELLLIENIADRIHSNSANLQLTYENNAKSLFLNNALSLYGQWNEGRATVSSGLQGENVVTQASHYRSLGLANKTRMVRRTAKGGGFEWTSTNRVSSAPQALAIGGDMTARQDIDVTTVSTANSFNILRNLQAHRWTLSATAHLNATYTALQSTLVHPDAPMAPHGDMDYMNAGVGVGPVAQYVNGAFQTSLSVPVAVAYTSLRNASVAGEETDADRVRLRVQPSFSLLWKANNNFTFKANAHYSTNETPWTKLVTANMMGNYRSLSRYRATLDDSHGAGANTKVSYKNMFSGLFAYLEGAWSRSWSDIAYGTTLDGKAHTVIEAAYMPNHSNNYSLTVYGRKDIDWHTMQIELQATGTRGKSEMLRQSQLTTYTSKGYQLRGTLAFDIVNGYRIDYGATWIRNRSVSNKHTATYCEWRQHGKLNLRLLPSRLFFNLNFNHTHNSSLSSKKKDYVFIGCGLLFKMSKAVELNLDADNLTNIHTYSSRSLGDMEEYYTICHLRPLSVTLTAHIHL